MRCIHRLDGMLNDERLKNHRELRAQILALGRLFQKVDVSQQLRVAVRAAPFAFRVAIGHAAKADALNHEKLDGKGRRLGAVFHGGLYFFLQHHRFIFHNWPQYLFINLYIYYGNNRDSSTALWGSFRVG